MIKRYDPDVTMSESDDGDYVSYEDYKDLKALHEKLKAMAKQYEEDEFWHEKPEDCLELIIQVINESEGEQTNEKS